MNLEEVRERIARDTGVPHHRQLIVVSEERARGGRLGDLAKRVALAFNTQRDLRSILISWINFVFLPEAVNRCVLPFAVSLMFGWLLLWSMQ